MYKSLILVSDLFTLNPCSLVPRAPLAQQNLFGYRCKAIFNNSGQNRFDINTACLKEIALQYLELG